MTTPQIRPSTFNGLLMEATGPHKYESAQNIRALAEITGHWTGESTSIASLRNAVEEGRRLGLVTPQEWSTMRMLLSLPGAANKGIRNIRR